MESTIGTWSPVTAFFVGLATMYLYERSPFGSTNAASGNTKLEGESESSDDEGDSDEGAIVDNYSITEWDCKMVLVVNMGIGMQKGKIAAQCGHATLGAYKKAQKYSKKVLTIWENIGQAKVAVKGKDTDHLNEIMARAKAKGLVTYRVADAGRTQIPAGSHTVVAIGPAPIAAFKGVTDDLKLL
jgi:peptidyl-tRNA hydrolase, PTH2 family